MNFTSSTSWSSFNYANLNLSPEAYVTVKKNRVKIYDSKKVYLNDNQTFEIELYNPTNKPVLAKIWLNGKLISPTGIIVPASNRVYLERFIDSPEKLLFKCFEVDNVAETKKQREEINGVVKVAFYDSIPSISNRNWNGPTTIYSNRNLLLDRLSCTTDTLDLTSFNPCGEISMPNTTNLCSLTGPNEQIETGRVTSGGQSNQAFESGTGNFQSYAFHVVDYQILPDSLRPVNLKEVRQYCEDCGSRIKKSSWKFCPTCGYALQ